MTGMHVIVANTITHSVGQIFQPIFKLFAGILAYIYAVIPNYAIAIAILTILIMGALTPLTVKSTKSMLAMQRIQPEIKKLQAKYKGAENRAQLNEEMMRLYKEEGVNPAGGCLPMFLQFPFLIILYDIIRGLTNVTSTKIKVPAGCNLNILYTNVAPRYIPNTSKMYCNLIASGGKMESFGIDLALKPFSHHGSIWAALPYFILVAVAVALQYIQMSQMNKRNAAAQANSQMAMIQKFMPIVFAYIYFLIPAAVLIYMIVSTLIRIATQDIIFRTGVVGPNANKEKVVDARAKDKSVEARPQDIALPVVADEKPAAQSAPKPATNPSARSKKKRKRKDR
jgi:YidC/Oxa1 family membrane protein insertase